MAVQMSEDIRAHGWERWELNPGWSANQPVGIMAAVYAITGPSPLYLLPLNAGIHGLSVVLLFLILRVCGFQWKESLVGSLPFAFFPSTLAWVAQFHKDGIYCLGLFGLFLGSLLILGQEKWRFKILGVLLILVGAGAVSVVRDYSLVVFAVAAVSAGLLSQLIFAGRTGGQWKDSVISLLVFFGALMLIIPLAGEKGGEGKGETLPEDTEVEEIVVEKEAENLNLTERLRRGPPSTPWIRTSWMPSRVDDQIHQLIHNRTVFFWLFPDATSYVDQEVQFRSASDVIFYIPRGIVVGLLAPFPHQWYDSRTTLTGNLQRMVSGAEMIVSYLLLGAGLFHLVLRPSKPLFFLVIGAGLMILALVYPLPAVGSLYRIRFGPYSILLAIGAASLIRFWFFRRARAKRS